MKHEGSSDTILRGIRRFVGEYEIPIGVALNHNSSLHQDAIWFIPLLAVLLPLSSLRLYRSQSSAYDAKHKMRVYRHKVYDNV